MVDQLELNISPDRSRITLKANEVNQGCALEVSLSVEELRALIEKLGKAHAHMADGRPLPLSQVQTVTTIVNPVWRVESVLRGILFAFYHPGYGPLGFTLSNDQVSQMIDILMRQLDEDLASLAQEPN